MHRARWVAAAVALVAGVGLAAAWELQQGSVRAAPAVVGPCGGEQLNEDTFPPLLAAGKPGGTGDAPGIADGRPEEFLPDEKAFSELQAREGAIVQMGVYRTNFSHASPSQAANIALVARKLNGLVIPAGAAFSYNRAAGPYTAAGGYGWGRMFVGDRIVPTIGGGVCQGASTLYNAVLLADLPVLERHPHGLTVPYLDPGRDATVTESGGLDFRFRNNTGAPLVLWAQAKDRWLALAIYGRSHPPMVEIHTEVLARQPFHTVTVRDPSLPPGSETVAAAGQEGVRARGWVTIQGPSGTRQMDLGTHTYRPSPRVILRGPVPAQGAGAAPGARPAARPPASA